jgi:L-asparaginase II
MPPATPLDRFGLLARVVRGEVTESWHFGALAAVLPGGRLVGRLGDPDLRTYIRSAAKPFQALPFVEAGGMEHFALEPADLALICASHGGRPEHVERVMRLLEKGDLEVSHLQCGAHWPFDDDTRRELRARGEQPTALHNNCSGKHVGMLLACRLFGEPVDNYLDPEHPLQQRILAALSELCGLPEAAVGVAVDGCGAPCYALPLAVAARAYAALAAPELVDVEPTRRQAMRTIVEAMTEAPEMVAGAGEFTTRLMQVTSGRILGKEGAEAFYGVAVRGPAAMGIALKVADGGERARAGVVLEALRQLGSLAGAEMNQLDAFYGQDLVNRQGKVVGHIAPDLEIEAVEA